MDIFKNTRQPRTPTEFAATDQQEKLVSLENSISRLTDKVEERLEHVRQSVDSNLKHIQQDNNHQLDQMRLVVDEKLQGTLEQRLGDAFNRISERLELVHKGIGEMQSLASGVGDLKRVLSNVKARGSMSEVQLGMLLEDTLSPDQFVKNFSPTGRGESVEYAIKLPGQVSDDPVFLPIDAKFPMEDYRRLIEAYEQGDLATGVVQDRWSR